MEIGQALAFFDSCRFWSVTTGAASCAFDAPKPKSRAEVPFWRPFVRTAVRRKHGESLDAMIVRCAALAAERKASGWLNPVPGAGLRCAGCGSSSQHAQVRVERRLRLALCRSCRQGLEAFDPTGKPVN
jgi:hypothetical protein